MTGNPLISRENGHRARASSPPALAPRSEPSVQRDLPRRRLKIGQGPVICQSCGHENPAGARFCNDCGAHLAAPTTTPSRAPTRRVISSRRFWRPRARSGASASWSPSSSPTSCARWSSPSASIPRNGIACSIACSGSSRAASTGTRGPSTSTPATASWRSSARRSPTRTTPSAPVRPPSDLARELGALAEDVRRESGLEFAVRMGLNSGEVVVGRIGDDLRMDYTAQGHVVGLAARVQQLAPPGGITVTEQTARLAAGLLRLPRPWRTESQGRERSRARVRAAGSGPDPEPPRELRARGFSRFVGRERELALLERALREAQSGRPTVVLVTAEPGAGKSRLCHEFVERARGVALHYARALSHGRMLPFHVDRSRWRAVSSVSTNARHLRTSGTLCDAASRTRRRPDGPGFLARPARGVRSRHRSFRTRSRSAPHTSVPVASRADPGSRSARAHVALDRGPALARPGERKALEILTERLLAPESAASRILLLRDHAARVSAACGPHGSRVSRLRPSVLEDSRTLLDDWLGSGHMLAPLRGPDRGPGPRQPALRRGDDSLARRAWRAAW